MLKRYSIYSAGNKTSVEKDDGEWVKFEDAIELLDKLTIATEALKLCVAGDENARAVAKQALAKIKGDKDE